MKKKELKDNSNYRINYTSDISDYSQKTIDYKHEISFHSKENFTYTINIEDDLTDIQRVFTLSNVESESNNKNTSNEKIIPVSKTLTTDLSYSSLSIPINILSGNSAFESIVLYLKEHFALKYSEIARLLGRNQKTIWVACNNAKKKGISFSEEQSAIRLPLDIFYKRKFSVLETIVIHLKNVEDLEIQSIATMLSKDYQTIWTVYRRAIKKIGGANVF